MTTCRSAHLAPSSLVLAVLLSFPCVALGQIGSTSGYTEINQGTVDVDWSSIFLMHYSATPIKSADQEIGSVSQTNMALQTGLTFKYFVVRNLAVGFTAGLQLQKGSSSVDFDDPAQGESTEAGLSDMGFPLLLSAAYYVHLNKNFFLVPSLGGGMLVGGSRSTPDPTNPNAELQSSLMGFLGKVDLNVVFYASSNVNLRAGLSGIFNAQTETIEGQNGAPDVENSSTVFDAGFNVGIGYSF